MHRSGQQLFANEEDCRQRRIDALGKLLDDVATYDRDRRGKAAKLRREVFRRAAQKHPLVRQADRLFGAEEEKVKAEIAADLGFLFRGQKTFVPDFVLQHEDGRRGLLEIVGFWTPQYLQTKLQTLEAFRNQPVLLAVAEATGLDVPALPANAFVDKSVVRLKDLLGHLS